MNHCVKFITDHDGSAFKDNFWHLVFDDFTGIRRTFCTGDVIDEGETDAEVRHKHVKRGGITCDDCLDKIKQIKSIKL